MIEAAMAKFAGSLGGSLGQAIGGQPLGPTISGGAPMDSRGFMDGSGWTVATGRSTATGGTSGGTRQDGASAGAPAWGGGGAGTMTAGVNPLLMVALLGGAAWFIARN